LFSAYFDTPSSSAGQKYHSISNTLSKPLACHCIRAKELVQELPSLVWHLEEPLADPYLPQTWYLAKMASSHCTVVYSATGWEEIFGSSRQPYLDRRTFAFLLARSPALIRDLFLFPLLNLMGLKLKYRLLREASVPLADVCHYQLVFNDRERRKIAPQLHDAFDPIIFSQRFHKLPSISGSITPALYYDSKTKLPDSKLFQYERLFSAHGIKVVNPYLHPPLVQFLAQVPDEIKFKGKMPAPLLRAFTEKTFPNFTASTEKELFLETWCNQPAFREIFLSLAKGRLVRAGLLSAKWIKEQLDYPYLVPSNFNQLWTLLLLELWFGRFIDEPIHL
jgi:asparagine synthase (glutamine-hydrolysing)